MAEHVGHAPRSPSSIPAPTPQILTRIIEKEHEIDRSIKAAQEDATHRLQEAKSKAAQMVAGHEEAARSEAVQLREGLLSEARRQAEEIMREGTARAEAIRATSGKSLEAAADRLLSIVLPGTGR